jgi:hypothetical protein
LCSCFIIIYAVHTSWFPVHRYLKFSDVFCPHIRSYVSTSLRTAYTLPPPPAPVTPLSAPNIQHRQSASIANNVCCIPLYKSVLYQSK